MNAIRIRVRVNEQVRSPQVRLISEEGEQLGVKTSKEALEIAKEKNLDMVEIAPQANPPVCKIMDYGKYKYEQEQKAKKAKKRQTFTVIKEIKFRPKIGKHDYETKKKHIERFLSHGNKVKVTMMFRGREMTHTDLGRKILEQLADELQELGTMESRPKLDGRNMVMVVAPISNSSK